MPTYSYETNEQPVVRVYNCSGDIKIVGWDEMTIEIASDDDVQENLHHNHTGVELNDVDDGVALRVPRGATVAIDNGDGDVQVRDVAQVQLVNIAGDALLHNIAGNVQLDNIAGDLNIERAEHVEGRGTASGDVRIVGATSAAVEQIEGDALVQDVPTVRLAQVSGDLRVSNAGERCEAGQVEGDAACSDVGTLVIGQVGGDLVATRIREMQAGAIEGDCAVNGEAVTLRLGNVGGDLVVKVATGTLTMGNVAGDASFSGMFDQVTLGNIAGDLALRLQPTPGGTYRAHVAGDAAVHLPDDANVTLHGTVVGAIKGAGVRTDHPTTMQLVWGAGEAGLHLHVIGDLSIHGPPPSNVAVGAGGGEGHGAGPSVYVDGSLDLDMGRLGRDFANLGREIAASFGPRAWAGKRGRTGNWRAGVGLNREQKEQIKQQVRAGVAQARASVDQALREVRVTPPTPPTPPMPPMPPHPAAPPTDPGTDPAIGATVPLQAQATEQTASPDRDAERLAILRMVGEGTITPEEAEDLLAALDS